MWTFGETTTDMWANCSVAMYQLIGWRDAVNEGLLAQDDSAIQDVVDFIVGVHACIDESELGALCPLFSDTEQEYSFNWLADWVNHIEAKHGGMLSASSAQIAQKIRDVVGVNPYE
jgi:hypothetical protein